MNEWVEKGNAKQREELKDPEMRAYLLSHKGVAYVKRMEEECGL